MQYRKKRMDQRDVDTGRSAYPGAVLQCDDVT